jgi:hypothetical protein
MVPVRQPTHEAVSDATHGQSLAINCPMGGGASGGTTKGVKPALFNSQAEHDRDD